MRATNWECYNQAIQKFNFLRRVLTDDGICDIEIRKCHGIAKDSFQKLKRKYKETGNLIRNN